MSEGNCGKNVGVSEDNNWLGSINLIERVFSVVEDVAVLIVTRSMYFDFADP
ncbi:MAG: hypothetical protein KDD45_12365 [Bdellovibrionales bacterium]|nr:hypothetical protein [Bdellovibrionales bacterium]